MVPQEKIKAFIKILIQLNLGKMKWRSRRRIRAVGKTGK